MARVVLILMLCLLAGGASAQLLLMGLGRSSSSASAPARNGVGPLMGVPGPVYVVGTTTRQTITVGNAYLDQK